ncbi:YmfQ family protein [Limnobaculum xujianqingii]|uniref:YmfQ family protein n=1 Tax=Limnobaculum xujianqingii TaxID=2738837 RepID=UPI00112DC680|nr:YmfQ family protein [Limnobaculum xujianqingii]
MNSAELLGLLLPPVSYDPNGLRIKTELSAEGIQLDKVKEHAQLVLGAITPFYAGNLLSDWERLLAILPPNESTYQQRLERVIAKLAETGGLNVPYFTRLAASLGYTITINEPQPFRAGQGRAGDRIYSPDIIHVWEVNIFGSSTPVYRFRAGISRAGERLTSFGDAIIETIFNDLKPAHTYVVFKYFEDIQ